MKLTDETLSAFLDNELTEPEMEAVRDQLAVDPTLTDRLAEMASVDARLQAHYGSIDERPMPEAITRMLEASPSQSAASMPDNVVNFPWWRSLRGQAGTAVAAAVIAGVALMQWYGLPPNGDPAWQDIARVLESQPSGQRHQVSANGATLSSTLSPRLTFRNQDGEWCRQFRLEMEDTASEQIACRTEAGNWEQVAQVEASPVNEPDTYQTASGGSALDLTLDRIMNGTPIGPERENTLLERKWKD